MSDLMIVTIAAASFGAGYVVGFREMQRKSVEIMNKHLGEYLK